MPVVSFQSSSLGRLLFTQLSAWHPTLRYHSFALQPFMIIGLFTPPKPKVEVPKQSMVPTEEIQQQTLFDV